MQAERLFDRHASFQPFVERAAGCVRSLQPISKRVVLVADLHESHWANLWASIRILFAQRGPSTVARLVAALIVNAVERVLWPRTAAHVFEERLVRVAPALAHDDSTTTVASKHRMPRVMTTALRLRPSAILGGFVAVAAFTVSQLANGPIHLTEVDAVATARLCFTGGELECANRLFVSAVATAPPRGTLSDVGSDANNSQTAEPLTNHVDASLHSKTIAQNRIMSKWQTNA